jgi:hypothetical protein
MGRLEPLGHQSRPIVKADVMGGTRSANACWTVTSKEQVDRMVAEAAQPTAGRRSRAG